MYGNVNLLSLSGSDIYKFGHRVIDALFTKEELQTHIVEPTKKSRFPELDSTKIETLKSEF
jgi:hypothetical protein